MNVSLEENVLIFWYFFRRFLGHVSMSDKNFSNQMKGRFLSVRKIHLFIWWDVNQKPVKWIKWASNILNCQRLLPN